MAAPMKPGENPPKTKAEKLSHMGATEDQMDARGVVPQRIDRKGSKVEDMAGTGEHDSQGG
jgi:hypothetical protein